MRIIHLDRAPTLSGSGQTLPPECALDRNIQSPCSVSTYSTSGSLSAVVEVSLLILACAHNYYYSWWLDNSLTTRNGMYSHTHNTLHFLYFSCFVFSDLRHNMCCTYVHVSIMSPQSSVLPTTWNAVIWLGCNYSCSYSLVPAPPLHVIW